MTALEQLVERLTQYEQEAVRVVQKWLEKTVATVTVANPDEWNVAYRFTWADTAFQAAADLTVVRRLLGIIKESEHPQDEIVARVFRYVESEAMRGAKYPPGSTSQCSNLVEQRTTAAWAVWHERIGKIIRHHEKKDGA